MGWLHVAGSAQQAGIVLLGALFRIRFSFDTVARTVEPSLALGALDDELPFGVAFLAAGASGVRRARTALAVAVHPITVETRFGRPARLAVRAPLAFPVSMWYVREWRIHTVYMEGNVTIVAQDKPVFVVSLPTTFAHGAIQASPSSL